jgi:hypothetical protein
VLHGALSSCRGFAPLLWGACGGFSARFEPAKARMHAQLARGDAQAALRARGGPRISNLRVTARQRAGGTRPAGVQKLLAASAPPSRSRAGSAAPRGAAARVRGMEPSDVAPLGGAALTVSNKENVPEAPAGKVADRRASLASWAAVGPTPNKLQDLARRCVRPAARLRPPGLQARNGPQAGCARAATLRRRRRA